MVANVRLRAMQKANWRSMSEVVALAYSFGPGFTVVFDGEFFNIIHTEREPERLLGRAVIART